jgi:hypothetical protein
MPSISNLKSNSHIFMAYGILYFFSHHIVAKGDETESNEWSKQSITGKQIVENTK